MDKSVLVLAKGFPPVDGGVETYSQEVVRAYLSAGFQPVVLTQTEGKPGWSDRDYPEGRVSIFNSGPGGQVKVFWSFFWSAFQQLRSRKFEFLHATTWRPALAVLPSIGKVPLVVTVHGREVMNYPDYLRRPMIRILRDANKVIAVSSATLDLAREAIGTAHASGTWEVAFNGITYPDKARAFERPYPLRKTVRILSLSRLVPRKNIQGCIKSLAILKSEGLDFEYWIGGRGPMKAALQDLVDDAGLSSCVKFLDYVPEDQVTSLYEWADIFLHPQTNEGEGRDFEGFGLVIADAMSFGCAVIAGEAGGPRDFVAHEQNGLLVNGLDNHALQQQIRRLITEPELRMRLGSTGRNYAITELSWHKHVAEILS